MMETWRSLQDAQGVPVLDSNGRFQKDPAATPTLFVMRKGDRFRRGFWSQPEWRPQMVPGEQPLISERSKVQGYEALGSQVYRVRRKIQ
jgi:hypothetical protein